MKNISISHGTMRTQDLIQTFLDALSEYHPEAYAQMMSCAFPPVPSYVMDEGDSSEWWNSEEAHYLLAELFGALDCCAPEGYYFGAHIGDGSDYGFWSNEDY